MLRMKSISRVASAIAMALAFAGAAQAADAPAIRVPTPAQLAQFPVMTGFRLSPDGQHMVAIESRGDTRTILVWKLNNLAAPPTVIGSKSMQISRVEFLKNDMLAVSLSQPYDVRLDTLTKTFVGKLYFTDLEGKKWIEPMAPAAIASTVQNRVLAELANPSVLSRLSADPDHVILANDSRGGETHDIYRYNVRTEKATRIMRLSEKDGLPLINAAGQPFAKSRRGSDERGTFIATDFRDAEGAWQEHFRTYVKDRDVVAVVAPGSKPNLAIIQSNVGQEYSSLYEYDIEAKKTLSKVFEHKYFNAVDVLNLNPDGSIGPDGYDGYVYAGLAGDDDHWGSPEIDGVIRGVAQALGLKETPQLLQATEGDAKAMVSTYGDVTVKLLQRVGGDKPTYLLRVDGRTYPTEYYLLQAGGLKLLAKSYPEIDRRSLGSASFVYYKSRDGLNIPAFLQVPNEQLCGPGPYSAVIHPHGGPWARDSAGYTTHWVAPLVTQCRVVLQPQYRGSAGWGRKLWYAGDAEWGGKMQDDKDDGAKWLIEQKLAAPGRIAMFGYSYGGYAAFAAAVRPNDLYKCAIAGAGVSDIERIWARFYTNPYYSAAQGPTVKGLSPLTKADQIKIPIMVYHGDRDQTVPLVQSQLFVDKAKASGQPVEFNVLKDHAHGPTWTRAVETEHLTLIQDYFAKGCGKGGL